MRQAEHHFLCSIGIHKAASDVHYATNRQYVKEIQFAMLALRQATEADKQFLWQLFRRVYEDVIVKQLGRWDDDAYSRYFEDSWPGNNYKLIERDGEVLGALWVEREPDHFWLREIQVCPEHQNKGIGTELLSQVIEEAATLGLPVRLRVLKQSRALPLYQKMGFSVVGKHKDSHLWMEYLPPAT